MNRNQQMAIASLCIGILSIAFLWVVYTQFRIDVPKRHIAILTKKVGKDLQNHQEIAPDASYKGIQKQVLGEGRYFYNPYAWSWKVVPMIEIPTDKMGVPIRLVGDDLPYGEIIAWKPEQKGIVPEVLRPGRYAINPYVEQIHLHQPVTIPAGYKGVVTLLAAAMPENPNVLLVEEGKRGVQEKTLSPGTYYINPYTTRIDLVDCRSQRFNLKEEGDMGFPSKDGFWVSLDGIIEFRVQPERASEVFVTYNDAANGTAIDEEIIKKIILPNARSFCRLRGSNNAGRDFIGGDTRTKFQEAFQSAMSEACEPLGIEIIQALIAKIRPPEAIADPIRQREVFEQRLDQYNHQIEQKKSEQQLAIEQALVKRNQSMVAAEQEVVVMATKAKEEQQVAITKAEENLNVAQFKLDAAKDEAIAILERGRAEAEVIQFNNSAIAAGWKRSVEAFSGNGSEYAKYVLYQKLAPGYRKIMANTGNSPLMDIFEDFRKDTTTAAEVANE